MPNAGMNAKGPNSDEWRTPEWLFKALDTEFGFTFDAAAQEGNALCKGWTNDIEAAEKVGMLKDQIIFCNPPYTKIPLFVRILGRAKATSVLLLPARTGTGWFLTLWGMATLRFFRKRVEFLLPDGTPSGSPRFDSLVAIVRGR